MVVAHLTAFIDSQMKEILTIFWENTLEVKPRCSGFPMKPHERRVSAPMAGDDFVQLFPTLFIDRPQ